jgi:predicted RecA/RadA family phage recombinase
MADTYLAQEGIEYMRNMRDDYVLYPITGLTRSSFIVKITGGGCVNSHGLNPNGCYFDDSSPSIANMSITRCATVSSCRLYYNSSTGKYSYANPAGSSDSGFIREIKIQPMANTDEIQVTSVVYWSQGSAKYSVSFSENLFNWVSPTASTQ